MMIRQGDVLLVRHETPTGDTMLYVDEPTTLTYEEHAAGYRPNSDK